VSSSKRKRPVRTQRRQPVRTQPDQVDQERLVAWAENDRLMSEDPDDRAIREAHGLAYEDDYEDRSLICRNGCGTTYFDVAVHKIRKCRGAEASS
jgi:hypothetical protein